MAILWLDTETVGLNGSLMRIQYAIDDGPIVFYDHPFPASESNQILLDLLADKNTLLVAYNASFDVYHLYRWVHEYVLEQGLDSTERHAEPFACQVLDLQIPAMLTGPFRNFAFNKGRGKSVARVRRIPRVAAGLVRERVLNELKKHVPSEFALLVSEHEVKGQPELVSLGFAVDGRATLKAHARYYGAETLSLADNWPIPPREIEKPWLPYYEEADYAPFTQQCQAVLSTPGHPFHVYCRLDILFLRLLAHHLCKVGGKSIEQLVDHHSDCVHAVAYTRYHGFEVDQVVLERTRRYYESKVTESAESLKGCDLKSAPQRLALLRSVDPLVAASNRKVLEVLASSERPSAAIADDMLAFGKYRQRLLQVEKVMSSRTGRAHPSLRVMGTATGRMAGTDGLNWQGIAQAERNEAGEAVGIRAALKCGMGGDFDALEVGIAAAAYHDATLQTDLDTGIDFHAMTGSMLPEAIRSKFSYDDIVKNKKKEPYTRLRKTGKTCNFAVIYGAQRTKIAETIGATEGDAEKFLQRFFDRYQGIGGYRRDAEKRFCTADTDNWRSDSVIRMSNSVIDLLGFTRRFDFEREVAMALWKLGTTGIRSGLVGSVTRTKEKGQQSIDNSIKSALLGSAIAIQAAVCRQACNSPVQSTGANLTKILMARLWNQFRVAILNCHDELILPVHVDTGSVVGEFLSEFRRQVPSLNIKMVKLNTWSDK